MGDYKIREATEDEIKKASLYRGWNIRQGAGWLLGLKVPKDNEQIDYKDFTQLQQLTQKIIDHLKKLEKPVAGTSLKKSVSMHGVDFIISTDKRFTRKLPIAFYYQLVAERKIEWEFEQFPIVLSLYGNRVFKKQYESNLLERHGVPIPKTIRLGTKLYLEFWQPYEKILKQKKGLQIKEPSKTDISEWIKKYAQDQDCIDLLNVIQGKLRNYFEKSKQSNK